MKTSFHCCLLFVVVLAALLVSSGNAQADESDAIGRVVGRILTTKQAARTTTASKRWQWLRMKVRAVKEFKKRPFQFLLYLLKGRKENVLKPHNQEFVTEAREQCTEDGNKKVFVKYGDESQWWESELRGCESNSKCANNVKPYQKKGAKEHTCVEAHSRAYQKQLERMESVSKGVEDAKASLLEGSKQRKAESAKFFATVRGHDDAIKVLGKIMEVLSKGEAPSLLEVQRQALRKVTATSTVPEMLLEVSSSAKESKLDQLRKFCGLMKKNLQDSTKFMKAEEEAQNAEWENVKKQNVLTITRGPAALADAEYLREEAKFERSKCKTRLTHAAEGFSALVKTCIDNHDIYAKAAKEYAEEGHMVSHVEEESQAEEEAPVNVPAVEEESIPSSTGTVQAPSSTGAVATSSSTGGEATRPIISGSVSSTAETPKAPAALPPPELPVKDIGRGSAATGIRGRTTVPKTDLGASGSTATGVEIPANADEVVAATAIESTGTATGTAEAPAKADEVVAATAIESTGTATGTGKADEVVAATAIESTGTATGVTSTATASTGTSDSGATSTATGSTGTSGVVPVPVPHFERSELVPVPVPSIPGKRELVPTPVPVLPSNPLKPLPIERKPIRPVPVKPIEEPVSCPVPRCKAPADGCQRVMSVEKNEMGCPKYPCGVEVCDGKAKDDDKPVLPRKPEIPSIPDEPEDEEETPVAFERKEKELAWIRYTHRPGTSGMGRAEWGLLYDRLEKARAAKKENAEKRAESREQLEKNKEKARVEAKKEEGIKAALEKKNAEIEAEEKREEKERLAREEEKQKVIRKKDEEKAKEANRLEKEEEQKRLEKEKEADRLEELQKKEALAAKVEEGRKNADRLKKAAESTAKSKAAAARKAAEKARESATKLMEAKKRMALKEKEEGEKAERKKKAHVAEQKGKKEKAEKALTIKKAEEKVKKLKAVADKKRLAEKARLEEAAKAIQEKLNKAKEAATKKADAERAAEKKKLEEKSKALIAAREKEMEEKKQAAEEAAKKPVDCQVAWNEEWSKCTKTCGSGEQKRTVKTVLVRAANDGKACPKEQTRACNIKKCTIIQKAKATVKKILGRFSFRRL